MPLSLVGMAPQPCICQSSWIRSPIGYVTSGFPTDPLGLFGSEPNATSMSCVIVDTPQQFTPLKADDASGTRSPHFVRHALDSQKVEACVDVLVATLPHVADHFAVYLDQHCLFYGSSAYPSHREGFDGSTKHSSKIARGAP